MSAAKIISMLFVCVLLTGCAGLYGFSNPGTDCAMDIWFQQIDGLADPPYPLRNQTGDELLLVGIVRDVETCLPIPGARVMFDLANAEGEYDGTQQGTTHTNTLGLFAIKSNRPGAYGGGTPHIHLYVGAPGYASITVGHNVTGDADWGRVEISLTPQS